MIFITSIRNGVEVVERLRLVATAELEQADEETKHRIIGFAREETRNPQPLTILIQE